MVRRMALLVGSLIFAVTCAPTPWAAADDSQSVRTLEPGYATAIVEDCTSGGRQLVGDRCNARC